jgi:hypothetical protein
MQNIISSVNEQFCWDQGSPHRHDCHDPPHTPRGGFDGDLSPLRRLTAVARSDPGEQHLLRWDSQGTQPGGEDYSGLWGLISGATIVATICNQSR